MSWVVVKLTPRQVLGRRFGTDARILNDSWVCKLKDPSGLTTPAPQFLFNTLKDPLDRHAGDTVRFLRYGSLEAEREVDRQVKEMTGLLRYSGKR